MSTATGTFATYGHEVEMQTLGVQIVTMVYFAGEQDFDRDVGAQRLAGSLAHRNS
jgi:hypothetical protein